MRALTRTITAAAAIGTVLLLVASGGQAVVSRHLYWTNTGLGHIPPGTIGEANVDGTEVNQSFITDPTTPNGVAVDSSYVYWTNVFGDTIGRANLDGTGVDQNFITGAVSFINVAVDANHVYWVNACSRSGPRPCSAIARANLDGTGMDQNFITGATIPEGLAVDAG
jgi:virginiamycin B lyase